MYTNWIFLHIACELLCCPVFWIQRWCPLSSIYPRFYRVANWNGCFSYFWPKMRHIAHITLTTEGRTNEMNRSGIQISLDTTFIPVSLMVEWVFPFLKWKFAPGDLLVRIPPAPAFRLRKGWDFSSQARSAWRCIVIYVRVWLYLSFYIVYWAF